MTELVLFRAGRALVVTLSALTLAHLLELSHRLAYDARLWAQLTSPDALGGRLSPHRPSPESHQELVVAFGTAAQLPSPIPSAYQFPPGA